MITALVIVCGVSLKKESFLGEVCDICHKPYAVANQSDLEDASSVCPIPGLLEDLLKTTRSADYASVMEIVAEEMLPGGDRDVRSNQPS